MPIGFFRGGLIENEVKEAVLAILRRGPMPIADLTQEVSERLDRPGLRVGQLTPIVLRLSEKGLIRIGGRGQGRICSLTLSGHKMARAVEHGGESSEGEAGASESQGPSGSGERLRQSEIEEFVATLCQNASVPIPAGSGQR